MSFLKVSGCVALVKIVQPEKPDTKPARGPFQGYPKETIGYTFYLRSEGKIFVAKNGSFLEKEFLSKEVSGAIFCVFLKVFQTHKKNAGKENKLAWMVQ